MCIYTAVPEGDDSQSSQEKRQLKNKTSKIKPAHLRPRRSARQEAPRRRVSGRSARFVLHFTDPKRYKGLNFNSLNQSAKIVWKWAVFWIKGPACDDETANIMMK